jgi:long-chain fatty acid transport protein
MYQYHRLYLRHFVLVFLLTVGQIIPCYGGGLYLYEVNATEVGLAGAGWAARADDASTVFTNPAGMTRIANSKPCLCRFI